MWSLDDDTFGLNDTSALIPEGCSLTQAHLVHRHGARYPAEGSAPAQLSTALQGALTTANVTGPLEFLSTWTYKFGAELLTPFGREELYVYSIIPTCTTTDEGVSSAGTCWVLASGWSTESY